jgi:hypothetical protein
VKFELSEVEEKKAKEFIEMCHLIMGYAAQSDGDMRILTFRYVFSEGNGIGQSSAIECEELDIGISLTDYESW